MYLTQSASWSQGRPFRAAAPYGEGRGAGHLGGYAPQPRRDDTTMSPGTPSA
ncbi:hypothetical protein ACLVWQ_33405 [Streptomyces sp. CWNU-52B]|uniref:hypothetical protein n=1 Tax=unclassified Streptomyces TaxID=2593676 RepID=UPI0039C0ABA5